MPPVTLDAGDIAILPRNDPHRLASRSGHSSGRRERDQPGDRRGASIASRRGPRVPKPRSGAGSSGRRKVSEHPLLDALPPLLTLEVAGGEAAWLDSSMRFLAEQQPSSEVVARLAELFVAQAVREYIERLPAGREAAGCAGSPIRR